MRILISIDLHGGGWWVLGQCSCGGEVAKREYWVAERGYWVAWRDHWLLRGGSAGIVIREWRGY